MTEALTRAASTDLAARLLEANAATNRWAAVVAAVPRGWFVPDVAWAFDPDTGRSATLDRHADPDGWARAVYSDTALTIQWDDGNHHGTEPGTVPTSSASQPSVVTGMLDDARLEPGMRVLEAGTGTGWSIALVCHVVGDRSVTSIEYDRDVAELAARNLGPGIYHPDLVVGDAAEGYVRNAPYDRVIATYGVRRIPAAWIAQSDPGGLVVAPWGTDYTHRDAVAVLTVAADGTASGRFTRPVEFMKDRDARLDTPRHADYMAAGDAPQESHSALSVAEAIGGPWDPCAFVHGLLLPNVTRAVDDRDPDAPVLWLYSLTDRSWAVGVGEDGGTRVMQSGPRRLWDALENAHGWWTSQGRPGLDRFGITADGQSETAWLDEPGNVLPRYFGG